MPRNTIRLIALVILVLVVLLTAPLPLRAQEPKASYPAMAPADQYLIPDEGAEVALARSGAPASVSDDAEVMVLRRDGYATAAKGRNGFVCIVERAWGTSTDDPQFWNPKVRSPICFNAAAARTFVPAYLARTRLVLAGKSKAEILAATTSALDNKEVPALEAGAMCYMLSKSQYLNDEGKSWHPHLMFFVAGNVEKTWGANLTGVPIISAFDAEERVTIFMVPVTKWSDGTPGPPIEH